MAPHLKRSILSNAPFKIVSLVLGYTFWYVFSHAHSTTRWFTVPLSFYKTEKNAIISAPEMVDIQLFGPRAILRNMNGNNLALHIDAQTLQTGPNHVEIGPRTLFLPDTIKLVSHRPPTVVVHIQDQTERPSGKE